MSDISLFNLYYYILKDYLQLVTFTFLILQISDRLIFFSNRLNLRKNKN